MRAQMADMQVDGVAARSAVNFRTAAERYRRIPSCGALTYRLCIDIAKDRT
jgi:hypothetical protein